MRFVVINGSPKGNNSITLQSIEYLKKHNPEDEYIIFNIGQQIRRYEDASVMDTCISAMSECDVVIFSYPVYTFSVPYQLAYFIELLKQRPSSECLTGKFTTQITTSKHFYDTTAHRFIVDNCQDLKMKVITGLAADMDDLLKKEGRTQLTDFLKTVKFSVKNNISSATLKPFKTDFSFTYQKLFQNSSPSAKQKQYDTVIVSDCAKDNTSLRNMIDTFKAVYKYEVREINLAEFKFSGGCLGCFSCAVNGNCIYKDGFEDLLRNEIQIADATIFAATVKDHSMGSLFKCYDDRQFCNGHRTVTIGKAVGYILDGYISGEQNLLDIIEARSEVGQTYLTGIATSESLSNNMTEESIKNLALTTEYAVENKLMRPQSFFGIGGMKIFRDLIYTTQGLMKADHRFYKKHGFYDFPQKKIGTILKMQLFGALMAIPYIRKKASSKMTAAIVAPYKKAIK